MAGHMQCSLYGEGSNVYNPVTDEVAIFRTSCIELSSGIVTRTLERSNYLFFDAVTTRLVHILYSVWT